LKYKEGRTHALAHPDPGSGTKPPARPGAPRPLLGTVLGLAAPQRTAWHQPRRRKRHLPLPLAALNSCLGEDERCLLDPLAAGLRGAGSQPQLFLEQLPGGGSSVSRPAPQLGVTCSPQADKRQSPLHLPDVLAERGLGGAGRDLLSFEENAGLARSGASRRALHPWPYVSKGDVVEALRSVARRRRPARRPSPLQPVPAPGSPQPQDDDAQQKAEHHLCHEDAGGFPCGERRRCRARPTARES